MEQLRDIGERLDYGETLPISVLTSAGLVSGLLVNEETYKNETVSSLQVSAQGGGIFSGNDGSVYRYALDAFAGRNLGTDATGQSFAMIGCLVVRDMLSVEVPAMRLNPDQVVSWWMVEHKTEGAKFQGGGFGMSF